MYATKTSHRCRISVSAKARQYATRRASMLEAMEPRMLLSAVYLDPTFGTNGFTSVNFPGSTKDAGTAISVALPDGKILLAGQEFDSNENLEVARLNPEGNLDITFGNNGRVLLHYGTLCQADSIAVQPDGKILVGGAFNGVPGQQSPNGFNIDGYAGVVRLNSDGTLDSSFGSGGLAVSTQVFRTDGTVHHFVLQPDGKIVEGGQLDIDYLDIGLTRFTAGGLVDTTFGNSGVSDVDFGSFDRTCDLTTDASGNLIVTATVTPFSDINERDIGVARLTPDGVLDPAFGNAGTALVQPVAPFTNNGAANVVVDSTGRILLGGAAFSPATNFDFSLVRFLSNGALDPSFGSGGRVTTDVSGNGGADTIDAFTLQADGKVLAGGNSASSLAVARYNTDGSLDTSFNGTGLYALNQPNYTNFANGAFGVGASQFGPAVGVTLQPDGSILTVGSWHPSQTYFLVARLTDKPPTIDLSGGFADNGQLTLNGAASLNGSALRLSGGGVASAFSTLPRDITEFSTQFTFKGSGMPGDNFSFVIQGNSNTALTGGLDRSVAINFDLSSNSIQTSLMTNGDKVIPGNSHFAYTSADTYSVTLNYVFFDGAPNFRGRITDLTTGAISSVSENVWGQLDGPALMKSGAAFVGFTSGGSAPDILSWSFTAPEIGATPFAPSLVRAKSSPDQITLAWTDNSSNEDGFDVEKSEDGFNFQHLAYVPANVTGYTDLISIPNPGHSLYYRVRAFNSFGSSVGSPTADVRTIVPPAAPTSASAVPVAPNEVDLTWQDNTGLISPYRIYRRSGGTGSFSLYALVHEGLSSYVDNQAPSGMLLEYRIVAFGDHNDPNSESNEAESAAALASATTPPAQIDQFGPQIVTNGSARLINGSLSLTDNQPVAETGSAWAKEYQDTSQFTTQFSFHFANSDPGGMTFETQDPHPAVADGHNALGDNSIFGFGGVGAGNALGLQFYLGGTSGTGGGATGIIGGAYADSINVTSAGINFGSGHLFNVTLAYHRFILNETIVDATTGATFKHNYWIQLGDDFELVGFSGAKPGTSQQAVSVTSWSYSGSGTAPTSTTFISASTIVTSNLALAPASGVYGASISLSATLQANAAPLAGQLIAFVRADNSSLGTATTNANGLATLTNISLAGVNAGTYANAFHATFAGDVHNLPSSASASLLVSKADALISVSGFSGTYTATPHGATGTATGVGGVDLSSQLSLGASFTNAPGGTANWSFSGGTNYNDAAGTVAITIAKASLTGIATTQDALNIAKQGAFTIDINSLTGLQSGDTVVSIFSTAVFSLTIGANTYLFAPTVTVDAATQTIHVAYSLKAGTASADTLRADLLALDAADGTLSTSAAKTSYSTLWITANTLNYTFTDDFLTRLFASK